jgi:radical SAM protein with 4Fe4S-binding SPASM domain
MNAAMQERIPLIGELELTYRCNQECAHCYVNLPSGDREAKKRELTFEEICRVIDEITEAGCLYLLLTGGEPMLRPDFLDVYAYAKRKGLLITIFCTGTLITPKIADYLAEWPPYNIEISIYGATEETYERVTGLPGSYRKCFNGIRLLLERRLPLKLKTVLISLNQHEFQAMEQIARDFGLDFKWDGHINARIDGGRQPLDVRVDPTDIVKIDQSNEERVTAWHEFCDRLPQSFQTDNLYTCGAGRTNFHIDPYGRMTPCTMTRLHGYELREGSFREGWYGTFAEYRKKKRPLADRCADCDLMTICFQCTGWAQLEHGVEWAPVDFLCEATHLRAEAFAMKHQRGECCDVVEGMKRKKKFALPVLNQQQPSASMAWSV